jgi:hypothetical protein
VHLAIEVGADRVGAGAGVGVAGRGGGEAGRHDHNYTDDGTLRHGRIIGLPAARRAGV